MQDADFTIVACKVVCIEVPFFAWNVAVAFFGLGCAIVRGIGEQGQSKYISNSTAQLSISKWSDSICNPRENLESCFFWIVLASIR